MGSEAGLRRVWEGNWRIQWRDDGTDYPALLAAFRAGSIPAKRLVTGSPYREVFLAEAGGRRLVIKRDWETDSRLEKRLWIRLGGTPYHRLLKFTGRAVARGCRVVQDVYLVAEKMAGPYCEEAWLIAEFVEGRSFMKQEGASGEPITSAWIEAIGQTLGTLHDYGLASNDSQAGNFIINERGDHGLVVIDLELDGPLIICQVNDALRYFRVNRGQVRVPMRDWRRRLMYALVSGWEKIRRVRRERRGRA